MTPRENFLQWMPPGKREAAEAYFNELEGRLSKLESGSKTPAPAVNTLSVGKATVPFTTPAPTSPPATLAPKPPATPTK